MAAMSAMGQKRRADWRDLRHTWRHPVERGCSLHCGPVHRCNSWHRTGASDVRSCSARNRDRKACVQMPARMARSDPSNTVRAARDAASQRHLASVLREAQRGASIHPNFGSHPANPGYISRRGRHYSMPWTNQGGGGPWGSGGKGPWGSGPQSPGPTQPDLEEILRRGQDKLRRVLPGGNLGGRGFALIALGVIALWGFSGFFRVEPDELGVVLRFGREVREVQPGLNYHLPYPIETVLTPKALRVNKIDIGMRVVDDIRRGGTTVRDVPEESLMLTGDENIVDVDFSVLWKVKPTGVSEFLFNIQNPEGTVKAVAESAMREVNGRSEI